jgi:hypothetical protein
MAARVCGWCGNKVVMRPVQVDVQRDWRLNDKKALVTATYRCDHCHLLSVAALQMKNHGPNYQDVPYAQADAVDRTFIDHADDVAWRPKWEDRGAEFPDVPDSIADVATEASACHVSGHYRAAVMLARSVLEATAKKRGVTGNLFQKIEKLGEDRVLSPITVDAAHAIRDSGNAVAHGDFVEYVIDVSQEESEEVIALMTLVLREAFQIEAQAKRVKEAAAARKKPAADGSA